MKLPKYAAWNMYICDKNIGLYNNTQKNYTFQLEVEKQNSFIREWKGLVSGNK